MKKVLIIAQYFPPAGGIAPIRIASFVRHLPAAGWAPSVVTVDWHEGNRAWIDRSQDDPSLQEWVIHRTREPDLRSRVGARLPSLLRWEAVKLDPLAVAVQLGDKLRYGEPILGSRFFLRDAGRFLRRHLAKNRYDVLLATSPELNAQAVAAEAARRFGIPWVADCRDDYGTFKEGKGHYVDVERALLQTAAAIVTVSKGVASEIEARVKREVAVVENGFEPEDRRTEESASGLLDEGKFNIVYTGSISKYYPARYNPATIFEALDLFLDRRPEARDRIVLHFFGDLALQPILNEFAEKFPRLKDVLRNRGVVDRSEALAAQRAAELLLLLTFPGRKGILTGKVFEYIAARRPVLSIPGDGGELDSLLERTKVGTVLDSVEEGAHYLDRQFVRWEQTGTVDNECDEQEVERYSRDNLTRRLADVLDSVCGREGAREELTR